MQIESLPGIVPVAPIVVIFEDAHECVLQSISGAETEPVQLEKLVFSRREVAHALGISVRSVAYLVSRGRLPVRRVGDRVLHEVEAVHKLAAKGVRRITA